MASSLMLLVLLVSVTAIDALDNVAELSMYVASKAEVMAEMTNEKAMDTFMHMQTTKKTPELVEMIQGKFGAGISHKGKRQGAQMQATFRGSVKVATKKTPAYTALVSATNMLNEMIHETGTNLEVETKRCEDDDEEQKGTMTTLRQQVATFNSAAAGARGRVVSAQGEIATLETNIDRDQTTLEELLANCHRDVSQLKYELKIILGDIGVMNTVLDIIGECPDSENLLQCEGCDVMIQHKSIQNMLGGLKSSSAREAVKNTMKEAFDEPGEGEEPVALTQVEAEHMLSNLRSDPPEILEPVHLNISEVPESPEPVGCVKTDQCKVGPKNCPKLKDRFMLVQSGIVDQKNAMEEQLRLLENHCDAQSKSLTELIEGMEEKLRVERVNLATATEDQNTAEAGSHTNAQQHEAAVTEYIKSRKTCCDNRNAMISEMCALDKIRGELNKVNGTQIFISDCEVSEWQRGECTVSCGGGTRYDSRTVIAHTEGNGVGCPPLGSVSKCNLHKCPIDCIVDQWSAWSECSAECGGGVKERSRNEIRKAQFDGEVCPSLEEEVSCGAGACNQDCVLSDWSDWGECSKACGTGNQRSLRTVEQEAKGTGQCWEPQDDERVTFKPCNEDTCEKMIRDMNGANGTKEILQCDSQVDLTIVLDGSGSLKLSGWKKARKFVSKLIKNLSPNVTVAVLVYSGPDTWKGVDKCLENTAGLNMETDCRVKWISHFTNDFAGLANTVAELSWPKGSTLTSIALGMVDADQMYGRIGAASKVVVVTDGKPLSNFNTKAAAKKLQSKADVIWVPVGSSAPLDFIKTMASKPQNDHVIPVNSFWGLNKQQTYWLNKIITTACPDVI